jgi:hypothetical protein
MGLFTNLAYLLPFLLWLNRGVGANGLDLRARFTLESPKPLHRGFLDANNPASRLLRASLAGGVVDEEYLSPAWEMR